MRTSRASCSIVGVGSRASRSRSRAWHRRRKPSCLSSMRPIQPTPAWPAEAPASAGLVYAVVRLGGDLMTSKGIFTLALCFAGSVAALAQNQPPRLPPPPANPPAPSVQAPADPGYEALIKTCKTPPPAGRGRGGGGAGRAGGAPAPVPGIREYKVEAIPGVIVAGQQWKFLWQEVGNNGDGIVGTDDGALLLAQNDNSKVLKLDKDG